MVMLPCDCVSIFVWPKKKASKKPGPHLLSLLQHTAGIPCFSKSLLGAPPSLKSFNLSGNNGSEISWPNKLWVVKLGFRGLSRHRITRRISHKLGTKSHFPVSPFASIYAI